MFSPTRSTRARSTTTRLVSASALVLTGALALSACSAPDGNSSTAKPEYELTALTPAPSGDIDSFSWSTYAEPYSLDNAYAFDYPDNQILANMCDALLRWDADLGISPGLATEWSNPTPTQWVYEIRPGVKFHDGTTLTAADVVASLSRHINPEVGSFWFSVYQNVSSIEQTGDMQVTVTTMIPDSQFHLAMAASPGVIDSAATFEAAGADYGNSTAGVNCTGPFSLKKWQSGESLTMERFDEYWDPALKAKAEEVQFVFLSDPNSRINAFKAGEIDGGWGVPSNAIAQLTTSGVGDVYFGLNTTVQSMLVGDMEGPMGDLRVRQALMHALDRESLVSAAEQGYADVTNALTTRSVWPDAEPATLEAAFDDLDPYEYDLDKAKKLIEEAGATGKEITIATAPITSAFDVVAQATAAAANAIGLKATIDTVSPDKYTTLFSDESAREGYDLFMSGWYLSTADPLEMYAVLRTGEFSNYGNWSNPEFDATVNDAISTMDATERSVISAKAQAIANTELPWLPLYEIPTTVWLGERITGVAPSINYMYFPWAATIGAR